MKIIVAGGSGLIGQELTRALAGDGHEVWVLSRSPDEAVLPEGVRAHMWDAKTSQGWAELASDADAIINLAGANIGARPWTNARKRLIRCSRIEVGAAIVDALRSSPTRARVVISMAGSGIYGKRNDAPLDETAPLADDFLASVGKDWEAAIMPVKDLGARLVILRSGTVLTPKDGVLAPFVLQNQLFAGGPLGSGKQWLPWVHIHDLVRAIHFVLEREDAEGIFNVAAPQAVTNKVFGRAVSKVMRRPFWLPVPAFALKLVLGEMSTLVLDGQRIVPARLQALGFQFEYDTVDKALEDLIG